MKVNCYKDDLGEIVGGGPFSVLPVVAVILFLKKIQ